MLQIQNIPVEKIIEYEDNNKIHTDENVDEIIKSIEKVGFRDPIEVDENFIILSGHGRYLAGKKMGMKVMPVIQWTDMTENQKKAYRLLANRVADLSRYNLDNLQKELEALQDKELMKLFDEFKMIINEADYDEENEDVAPIPSEKKPLVKEGDLFQLGDHFLYCGDATLDESYNKLLNGTQANMLFTDPPYNVNYKGKGKKTSNGIKNDNMDNSSFKKFLQETFRMTAKHIRDNTPCYVFHSHTTQSQFEEALNKNSLQVLKQLIRNKPSINHVGGDYKQKHEPFFYASNGDPKFYGDIYDATVLDFHGDKSDEQLLQEIRNARKAEHDGKMTIRSMKRHNVQDYEHPTQKPVGLVTYALQNSSRTGEAVLDPFGGSGTTLIACEKTQRQCYMMELDPKYVEVIIARYWGYVNHKKPIKCINRKLDIGKVIANV